MKLILATISLITLSACATTKPALHSGTSDFGNAVRHNIAVQVVAPTPEQKNNTFIPADATKRAKARENYRNGETPEPQPITTTN